MYKLVEGSVVIFVGIVADAIDFIYTDRGYSFLYEYRTVHNEIGCDKREVLFLHPFVVFIECFVHVSLCCLCHT